MMSPELNRFSDNNRTQIKSRMLQQVIKLWDLKDSDLEEFDPLVSLLLGANAVEFEKIYREVALSQSNMLDKLSSLLLPDVYTGPKPAHAIVHAQAVEPHDFVTPETQFYCTHTVKNIASPTPQSSDFYFSPIGNFPISSGEVKYLFSGNTLSEMKKVVNKEPVAYVNAGIVPEKNHLWLGLEMPAELESIKNLSFFITWKGEIEKHKYYSHLRYAEWYQNDQLIETEQGVPFSKDLKESLLKSFSVSQALEAEVNEHYYYAYTTVAGHAAPVQQLYPEEFSRYFTQESLAHIKKPCVWFKVVFTSPLPQSALEKLYCHLNCVPCVNRRLNVQIHKLSQPFNIIPLQTEDYLLDVYRVEGYEGTVYNNLPFSSEGNKASGTYSIRQGDVRRFSSQNAKDAIAQLLILLREESAAFTALDDSFLTEDIRQLNQFIARLEQKFASVNHYGEPRAYVMLNPAPEEKTVKIKFWTTQASAANQVPIDSSLALYEGSSIQSDRILFITSTTDGREKPDEQERLKKFRYALLSRERIISIDDVKNFCWAELGDQIQQVVVKRGVLQSKNSKQGLLRILEVVCTKSAGSRKTPEEWERICSRIEQDLSAKSIANSRYRVSVVNP